MDIYYLYPSFFILQGGIIKMRLEVPQNLIDDKIEIIYNKKIYTVNDSEENYQKFSQLLKDKNATSEQIYSCIFGEEAAKEILDSKPSRRVTKYLAKLVICAFEDITLEELEKAEKQNKKK